jgi:hypothetical protein
MQYIWLKMYYFFEIPDCHKSWVLSFHSKKMEELEVLLEGQVL